MASPHASKAASLVSGVANKGDSAGGASGLSSWLFTGAVDSPLALCVLFDENHLDEMLC